MSQFIVVNNPVEMPCSHTNSYADKSIIFTNRIQEIYSQHDGVEIITLDGEGIKVQNTFEDIINQLKGQ